MSSTNSGKRKISLLETKIDELLQMTAKITGSNRKRSNAKAEPKFVEPFFVPANKKVKKKFKSNNRNSKKVVQITETADDIEDRNSVDMSMETKENKIVNPNIHVLLFEFTIPQEMTSLYLRKEMIHELHRYSIVLNGVLQIIRCNTPKTHMFDIDDVNIPIRTRHEMKRDINNMERAMWPYHKQASIRCFNQINVASFSPTDLPQLNEISSKIREFLTQINFVLRPKNTLVIKKKN